MAIKLIVGLGNPGAKYALTRHNAGAQYISLLSKQLNVPLLRACPKFFSYTAQINISNIIRKNVLYLVLPATFINSSGEVVKAMMTSYHIKQEELLVAHDELDLPPGISRFKFGGNYNSHNGLRDIIKKLNNSTKFHRLRIGIGHPKNKNEVINFVLEKPTSSEQVLINSSINEAVYCTKIWLDHEDSTKAINRLHAFKGTKENENNEVMKALK